MSSRMISDDMWRDSFIGRLTFLERLVWIGLITVADDQGRLEEDPIGILAAVFPLDRKLDERPIVEAIEKMTQAGKVVRYKAAGGKTLLQIVNWWKWQHPSWAAPSQYPAPEGWRDRVKVNGKGNKVTMLNWEGDGGFESMYPGTYPSTYPSTYQVDKAKEEDIEKGLTTTTSADAPEILSPPLGFQNTTIQLVTGGVLPADPEKRKWVSDSLLAISKQRGLDSPEKAAAYLRPFRAEWMARGFSATRFEWLEWAAVGEIPEKRTNGNTRPAGKPEGSSLAEVLKRRKAAVLNGN